MKVKEYLKSKKNKYVKLGFVDGSGFVFAGLVNGQEKPIIEQANKRAQATYRQRKKAVAEGKKKVNVLVDKIETEKDIKNKVKLLAQVKELRAEIDDTIADIQKCEVDGKYCTLLNREVIEDYQSMLNSKVNIALATGIEIGRFWLCSECRKEYHLEGDIEE